MQIPTFQSLCLFRRCWSYVTPLLPSCTGQVGVWTALDTAEKAKRVVRCVEKQTAAAACGRPFMASTCVDEANVGLATLVAALEVEREAWPGTHQHVQ